MIVFDEIQRDDFEPASYTNGLFSYLNTSAQPVFMKARLRIEKWFAEYPKEHQAELRSRLRSSDDQNCEGAIFELTLHELLLKLGCSVEIHPSLSVTNRFPDFFVQAGRDERFFMEATLATYQSPETLAAQARINQVFETIKRRVDSNVFYLDLEIKGAPKSQPPSRKLSNDINTWLAQLDPDKVGNQFDEGGFDSLPVFHFSHHGWQVRFRPIPKKKSKRGVRSKSPIGMIESEWKSVDHRTPLRNALEAKASSYGELTEPFMIAVNCLEHIDDIDIMEALFGKENWIVGIDPSNPDRAPSVDMQRVLDGFWTAKSGPEYTRISGVLLFLRYKVWDIENAEVRLYHNPWAKKPYRSVLRNLPQSILKDGRMENVDGISLFEILGSM